jgi:hypothetical protein
MAEPVSSKHSASLQMLTFIDFAAASEPGNSAD